MAVLKNKPLLLRCAEARVCGNLYPYEGGSIADAMFVFFCGRANIPLWEKNGASRKLAECFGYSLEQRYSVYVICRNSET